MITIQNPDNPEERLKLALKDKSSIRNALEAYEHKFSGGAAVYTTPYDPSKAEECAELNLSVLDNSKVILDEEMSVEDLKTISLFEDNLIVNAEKQELSMNAVALVRTERLSKLRDFTEKLQNKKIAIFGLGTLGTIISESLVLHGVKSIFAIDYGYITSYNIYYQRLYTRKDVNKKKVDVMKAKLEDMGGVKVDAFHIRVPSIQENFKTALEYYNQDEKIEAIISKCDLVIAALDKKGTRMALQSIATKYKKPFLNLAVDLMGGHITYHEPGGVCYNCFKDPNGYDGPSCTTAKLSHISIVAALGAEMAIKILNQDKLDFNQIRISPNTKITPLLMKTQDTKCECSKLLKRGKRK